MDLGTSGWTEFHMSEDVASYMAQNIELFDCETGLVHSHHTMGAFFSGQDIKMVQQEGNDTNCFVSLVVDTRGQYVARITRKVQSKSEVTVKSLGSSYEFFGDGSKAISKDNSETTKIVTKEYIEYFDLQVERHEVPNSLGYLDARFDEIERKKAAANPPSAFSPQASYAAPLKSDEHDTSFFNWLHSDKKKESAVQPCLDFSKGQYDKSGSPSADDVCNWTPDPKKVHEAAVHMVTLNLILNPKDFNFKHWVSRHMTNVYRKVFGAYGEYDTALPTAFSEWRDFIIQFTLDYFDCDDAPAQVFDDPDLLIGIVAQALIDELSEYTNLNPYIQEYINTLYQYIV